MPQVTDERLEHVADQLWSVLYERPFRGKKRGRYAINRLQMKQALGVAKLHNSTIQRLQDVALRKGLIIVDLDDPFACIETKVVKKYRRPPKAIFNDLFALHVEDADDEELDYESESEDED
ncbi:MAG: hypothetical protein ABSE64_04110 [Vulcanimicrobiaceae bacterium]|jgi:hypothetical protein